MTVPVPSHEIIEAHARARPDDLAWQFAGVAGVTTYLDGEPTSALPGKMVRSSTMRSLKV